MGTEPQGVWDLTLTVLKMIDCTFYVLHPQNVHPSRLTNAWVLRQAGTAATTRNWRTLSNLYELARRTA